eukprot:GILI01007906.1.p1 GENE.GILI01007906.1~~GILI01007906.1.p1  ORF type:complete len:459 (+),score=107.09 GILI01007906.1:88-1464(+)
MTDRDRGGFSNDILFNLCKKEAVTAQSGAGFTKLFKKLKASYKVQLNKDDISYENFRTSRLVVFGCPRERFTEPEFQVIKEHIQQGGSVLLLLGEGGENKSNTNTNYLTEEFGIAVNSDTVVRTVYYKYLHPKEVFVANGITNRELSRAANGLPRSSSSSVSAGKPSVAAMMMGASLRAKGGNAGSAFDADTKAGSDTGGGLEFVFPYGATLSVQKPAITLLSSGPISYPIQRPVAACYQAKGAGRLMVIGSYRMFDDEFYDKEDNAKLLDVMLKWCLGSSDVVLDAEEDDIAEFHHVPDIAALSDRLRSCLQEGEELPRDFTTLFDDGLFKFDTNLIPQAIKLYEDLNVKHEQLTLIPPQFETPMPPLQPAVFTPVLREPPAPALDLFDLDEQFASEKIRLAQLTNKCTDDDLDYYVRESGDILGVSSKLGDKRDAKSVLHFIFTQLVKFKKLNPES